MKDFRDLNVWNDAHRFVLAIYEETGSFPRDEIYGLTSQLRRAAVSIAANIAEGCGRGTQNEFRQFLQMAMGSASESEYHLLLARDLKHLDVDDFDRLTKQVVSVKRMLSALIRKVSLETGPRKTK